MVNNSECTAVTVYSLQHCQMDTASRHLLVPSEHIQFVIVAYSMYMIEEQFVAVSDLKAYTAVLHRSTNVRWLVNTARDVPSG